MKTRTNIKAGIVPFVPLKPVNKMQKPATFKGITPYAPM